MVVSTVTPSPASLDPAGQPRLTMVDRSDSGCRLHGPALAGNPILPGVLIAFREDAASPWTLAVVRRVRKRLAGKRVEIGVEYLGNDPRRIGVVLPDSDASPAGAPGSAPLRVTALYLPREFRSSGTAIQDAGPAGMRACTRGSPFGAVARRRVHDPAEGTARGASRLHSGHRSRSSTAG